MKISFSIYYPTHWGQTIYLTGSIPALGNRDVEQAVALHYTHNDIWEACVEIPDETASIDYNYFLKSNGQVFREPWERKRRVEFQGGRSKYLFYDVWQEKPKRQPLYSSAFTNVLFRRDVQMEETVEKVCGKNVHIKVFAPNLRPEQHLAISGNQAIWGNWDTDKAMKMTCKNFPEWEAWFDASRLNYPVEYKFIVYSNNTDSVCWEAGFNRILDLPLLKEEETAVVSGLTFREESMEWKGAGVVIPIFSLRSEESFGIGDFHDLKKMVDWVKLTGQKVIQTLPINDTTMRHDRMDSYPYNAISIFALHPLYLNLSRAGELQDKKLSDMFRRKQKELNALEQVDYEAVDRYKWMFIKAIYQQEGDKTFRKKRYKEFFRDNQTWLVPYAAYSFLREKYQTPDFRQWEEYAVYDKQKTAALCSRQSAHYNEIALYYFLQYQLHIQLKEAKEYAVSQGVILKGDIPIGISDVSIEAWTEPQYFKLDFRAGAPPDDFSATGQNWGFPTYNWEEMERDDYAWWKKRFRHMAHYFDAYRIDHILGFFRIWEIPASSVQALTAVFHPALPFSLEEMQHVGFGFDEGRHTRPQLNGRFLSDLFGVYAQEAVENYLCRVSERFFTLRPEIDTQQKIKARFEGQHDFKSLTLRDALFRLANEALFIPDRSRPSQYHPRIAADQTYAYRELSQADKQAFDYLYWDYFYRRQDNLWRENGRKRLIPLISSTDMLVCGEDLGMIPACVPEVMEQLQILSLEIERMPKESNIEFTRLDQLPYHSICMTSTHDMATIRGWWEEDREKTQRYYNQVLRREGDAPTACLPDICRQIVENHLASPAMWTIVPLQDWMSLDASAHLVEAKDERINNPSHPRHYWRYRMRPTIENLLKKEDWNTLLRQLIKKAGRL